MRVIFFGTAEFAVPSLERLASAGHAILMCVTQPDRPQGRGLTCEPSPVKRAAVPLGLPVAQPARPHAALFESLQPEVGVVIAYGQLIRRDLLCLPAHGMLGVHPSLLPRYRGAAPVAWAFLKGETTTGVTIFRLNERLDAGDIIAQRAVAIGPDEDADALTRRLAALGADELVGTLAALAGRRATFTPQDESQASLAPKLTKAEGRIDWQQPAGAIDRLVRATVPWPGAVTEWEEAPLKIWRVSVGELGSAARGQPPGTIAAVGPDGVTVVAGAGSAVMIREVQPSGRRRMHVREFLAGHPLHVGDRFGRGDA